MTYRHELDRLVPPPSGDRYRPDLPFSSPIDRSGLPPLALPPAASYAYLGDDERHAHAPAAPRKKRRFFPKKVAKRSTTERDRILARLATRPARQAARLGRAIAGRFPLSEGIAWADVADDRAAAWSEALLAMPHLYNGVGMLAERKARRYLATDGLTLDDAGIVDGLSRLWAAQSGVAQPRRPIGSPVAYVARIAIRESSRRERRAELRHADRIARSTIHGATALDTVTIDATVARIAAEHADAIATLAAPSANNRTTRIGRVGARAILAAAIEDAPIVGAP